MLDLLHLQDLQRHSQRRMSLTKKDPSFCVAANDPHLVSLGGGRLSTAVTIHNIPIGDTTIGSSTRCSISLNGTGIRPVHCTIYRSEENEVTLVPEREARILIDGHKIEDEVNLTQGAMITIGKSYYLRFNNPAEAQQIRTAMGSNERISMPQIDFAQERQRHSAKSTNSNGTNSSSSEITTYQIDSFYETTIHPSLTKEDKTEKSYNKTSSSQPYHNLTPIDINSFQCPKVFTADLVTVNMPAKDVLGQKYTKFAMNFAENQRNEKNFNNAWHNAQKQINNTKINGNVYDNVPVNSKIYQQESLGGSNTSKNSEYLVKLKNANEGVHKPSLNAYDRYPKLGNLQIFPMTTINNEINTQNTKRLPILETMDTNSNISKDEKDHLEDMLKICSEYTDRQNQNLSNCSGGSINSSPIVQNRIKTNGSLPRDKKSPFQHDLSAGSVKHQTLEGSFNNLSLNSSEHNTSTVNTSGFSSGYENVRLVGQNRVELNGQLVGSPKSSYENVVIGKYVPQSPRTKIRTNCMSPKRDQSFSSMFSQQKNESQTLNNIKANKQQEYDDLLKTFGEKLQQEMQNIEECSRYQPSKSSTTSSSNTPHARSNKNINNLKLNLKPPSSLQNSPKPSKKPAPAPRTLLKAGNNNHTGGSLPHLADSSPQHREDVKGGDNMIKAEFDSLTLTKQELENILDMLQDKIHRLEAQRNATRVMEENQQAKLKQSIEMKMDQVKRLKHMLKQKPNNECLKEELKNIGESLDNDRKQFEDLEFQYLEEESEWHAYHEELKTEEKILLQQIADKDQEMKILQSPLTTTVSQNLVCESPNISQIEKINSSSLNNSSLNKPYDIGEAIGIMSQSLFGSAEILCPKRNTEDVMSKSVNENMFFNNKIEFGGTSSAVSSSTPKRVQLKVVNIDNNQLSPLYKEENISKSCESFTQAIHFNLSLDSDDFEVNPLEKRIPSQDDIDRISKLTTDSPISSQGATTKIFDSIKEIERNRQLLLAQQGHHVIEHERQKMHDLKKKMHSEARAQYLSMVNNKNTNTDANNTQSESQSPQQVQQQPPNQQLQQQMQNEQEQHPLMDKENQPNVNKLLTTITTKSNDEESSMGQQRHSQPEFETSQRHYVDQQKRHSASSRPLSETNSDNSCDVLAIQHTSKSNMELSTNTAYATRDEKRFSTNSNDGHILGSNQQQQKLRHKDSADPSERKRILPKHQRPLTRYLPIFSPDLDLRQHIESAGHQIALCPHVFVDATSCRGYLHKLGATFHGWSKRWFVLDRQRNAFIYYSDKLERKPRGGAYFSTIDEVYLDHLNVSKSGRPHCTFIVKTKKRSYQLQAASDAAARIWIDAIITGAQGNLDY